MDVFGQGGGEKMANHYDVPFLGAIPLNPNVRIGGDTGKPIVITEPESDAAKALQSLAEAVAARVSLAALSQNNTPTIDII
jgi:ATP-binding protein involved in chromosome partitioning